MQYAYLATISGSLNKKKCVHFSLQKKSNTPAYQNRCVLRLILYHVCVNLPVMIFSYPAFRFMGLRSSLPLPHWYALTLLSWLKHLTYFSYLIASILHLTISACKYESTNVRVGEERPTYFNLLFCRTVVVSQVLFYFVLEDFIFYWGHRALHTKWLYKHVHSVHHE